MPSEQDVNPKAGRSWIRQWFKNHSAVVATAALLVSIGTAVTGYFALTTQRVQVENQTTQMSIQANQLSAQQAQLSLQSQQLDNSQGHLNFFPQLVLF
jgi:uncharacterized protein HemX